MTDRGSLAKRRYVQLMRLWGAVFFVVGLGFAVMPEQLASWLTALGRLLRLEGSISLPAGNLAHVLTLSLMGSLVLLAECCARLPERRTPFLALVTSKTISTIGFLTLAALQGSTWITCAFGDGFVAVTVLIARWKLPPHDPVASFVRRWRGLGPRYEVWYGKLNHAPGHALWFRYFLLDGEQRLASVWAILFGPDGVQTGGDSRPLGELPPGPGFHLPGQHLEPFGCQGQAGELAWQLSFEDSGRRFSHVPWYLRWLGIARTRYEACLLDLKVSGWLEAQGVRTELDRVPGMLGHIDGTRHAHSWAWAHCNAFDGDEDVVFEGLAAHLAPGGRVTRPLCSFALFVGERAYSFNAPSQMLGSESVRDAAGWRFETTRGGVTLRGRIAAPEQVAVVEYTDTDGARLWCRNSKLATLELELADPAHGGKRSYRATGTCAYEWVDRTRPEEEILLS